jgi:hypothetical protein
LSIPSRIGLASTAEAPLRGSFWATERTVNPPSALTDAVTALFVSIPELAAKLDVDL